MLDIVKVREKLNKKERLLAKVLILEEKKRKIKEKIRENNFDIKSIQEEIFIIMKKIDYLNGLVDSIIKFKGRNITLKDYTEKTIEGFSIENIERELVSLTGRIKYLYELLDDICKFVGHDYKYLKSDYMFSDGLEVSYEEMDIYCCSRCGKIQYREKEENEPIKNNLEELYRGRRINIYQSRFKIEDYCLENDSNYDIMIDGR